jgi:hypothetical protein
MRLDLGPDLRKLNRTYGFQPLSLPRWIDVTYPLTPHELVKRTSSVSDFRRTLLVCMPKSVSPMGPDSYTESLGGWLRAHVPGGGSAHCS